MLSRIRFFNGGYCSQLANLVGRRSWRFERFHAVFVHVEHPQHGAALIDTGYSPRFFEATRGFPQRFYRWLTPVTLDPARGPAEILRRSGIDPTAVRTVFVTHFHADHIGGIGEYTEPRFVHRVDALAELNALPSRKQVRHGFLAELVPADFAARGVPLDARSFTAGTGELSDFRVLDFWGDGSLVLVDLPGHAAGHYGVLLRSREATWFYIVDATWDVDVLLQGVRLPMLTRRLQASHADYVATQSALRRFAARSEVPLLACHCPRTQLHVENIAR